MTYEIYTQKELMDKVKPRHTGGYRLDLQVNNMRKTFYSTKKGDTGRRDCARKALAWINGDNSKRCCTVSTDAVYGAIPFSNANDGTWWYIDQADSPYWAVLNNINAMRAAGGLSALSASSSLDSIAYSRCDYQLKNNTLSHDGAQTPEILAQSQKSASEVCSGWQNSPSHYAVIMNPNFTQIGICCFYTIDGKTIWCCTFS